MAENRRPIPNMPALLNLMRSGGSIADLLDAGGEAAKPDTPVKVYRGEAFLKDTPKLGADENVGKWYTANPKKAARYPSESAILGKVTRSFDSTAEDIIQNSYKAMSAHAKTILDTNLEKGLPNDKAYSIYANNLNQIDDFHIKYMNDLKDGKLSKDKLMQLAMTSMEEGIFDQKGKIDISETFKRGNYGVAAGTAATRGAKTALPYLLKGAGIAALPLDLLAGANQTGLDPQEEIGKAMGIEPNVFYNMPEEDFAQIEALFRQAMEGRAADELANAQTVDPTVP